MSTLKRRNKMTLGGKYEAIKVWVKNEIKFNEGLKDTPMADKKFYKRAETKVDVLKKLLNFIKKMDKIKEK